MSRATRRRVPDAALLPIVVGAWLLVAYFALRNHLHQPDETISVVGARAIDLHFSEIVSSDLNGRGPERLTSALLAGVGAVVPATAREFEIGHVVFALAWALTALPTYALTRGLGVARLGAAAVAILAVAGPWAVFGLTFLNTTLGVLTLVTLVWAMWRTTVRPSVSADLLVVAAFALAVSARVGHAPFVLALVPAVLAQAWHDRPPDRGAAHWARRLPAQLWRTHPVLVLGAAAAVAALAVKGQAGLLGSYGNEITGQHVDFSTLWLEARRLIGRTAVATGLLPMMFALPWLAREVVRPRSRESGAFATLAVASFAIFLYVFYTAQPEDRYMAVGGPLVLVAFGAAFFRREAAWLGVGIAGLVVARFVATVGLAPYDGPFANFLGAGSMFVRRVVLSKLDAILPGGDAHVLTIALLAVVAVAVVCGLRSRLQPRLGGVLTVGVAGALVVAQVVAGAYVMRKFTHETGPQGITFADQAFVDQKVLGQRVGMLVENPTGDPALGESWGDAYYFNRSIMVGVAQAGAPLFNCCPPYANPPVALTLDTAKGTVTADRPVPRYVVAPTGWSSYGLNTRTVARGLNRFTLERFAGAPRLSFVKVSGTLSNGWGAPGRDQRVRLFPHSAHGPRTCVEAVVSAPPRLAGELRFALRTGAAREHDVLKADEHRLVRLALRDAPRDALVLHTAGATGQLLDGSGAGALLSDEHVASC